MANKREYVIVHHSITPRDLNANITESSFNNSHKRRGFPKSTKGWYIGYHFVVFGDGEVRQYRKDNETGAHCREGSMNFKGVGICMVGNFDKEVPSKEQALATLKLIKQLQKDYKIPSANVQGHREYATYKSCPGNNIPDDIIGYLASFDEDEPSEWAKGFIDEAKAWGVSNGKRPLDNITREEAITMVMRAVEALEGVIDDKSNS